MQSYVGYGFNVNDLQSKDWLALMHDHDPDEYECFIEDTLENEGKEKLDENLLADVEGRIADISSL